MAQTNQKKPSAKSVSASKAEAAKANREARRAAFAAKAEAARARSEATAASAARLAGGKANGFINFVRQQGVIGLAVGLALGTAAGDTVKKLVEGFINPIVQLIVGSRDALANATWTFHALGRSADFKWGAFVSSLITLVATALVIYLIVHGLRLDRLDKKKDS